jgi:adenylosuccinate synthase
VANIKVVIGSNFGDEGKGLMTDYFCHQSTSKGESCIVVMSNGGAQRGHTVVDTDGTRHVFKHFGAGTLAGADTYCADDFILNPMTFCKEYDELQLKYLPQVYVHPNCKWSTPYDMFINQIVEETREDKKHGSCGMGIWETICRYEKKPCVFNLFEFAGLSYYTKVAYLMNIRDAYMIERLKEYGIKSVPTAWRDIVYSDTLIEHFIQDVQFMVSCVRQAGYSVLKQYQNVVFENGQGLLLDQNQTLYGDNTTPSNTGVANPLKVINSTFNNANLEVCYVTRTYLTRHGAGRFEEECSKTSINADMFDETNQTNQFQGGLRYGELVTDDLIGRVQKDLQHLSGSRHNWTASFGVTHTNEKQFDYSTLARNFVQNIYLSDRKDRDSVSIFNKGGKL